MSLLQRIKGKHSEFDSQVSIYQKKDKKLPS